jgi:hypothetical protein
MLDAMARRRLRRRSRTAPWLVAIAIASTWAGVSATASAGNGGVVQGKQGLEIEGVHDRRGFYVGGGVAFGGTFFWSNDFLPAIKADLALGGGITKRFTLGVDLHVTPYLAKNVGVAFGGDVEGTGYVFRGLFLRAGLGVNGVPKREQTNQPEEGLTIGLGGAGTVGYEFWLSTSAALGLGFTYDVRFVPGSKFPRQTLLVGVRFIYF